MGRYTRLRPVRSIKHVVDQQGGVAVATLETVPLVDSTDTPSLADIDGVETGATVSAIYLRVEVLATTASAVSNIYMAVGKSPGNNITFPNPNVIGASDSKKFIIHQEMVMVEKQINGNPRTLFVGVIKIPRGYKRFGYDDQLKLLLFAPGIAFDYCVQCIYKEFR